MQYNRTLWKVMVQLTLLIWPSTYACIWINKWIKQNEEEDIDGDDAADDDDDTDDLNEWDDCEWHNLNKEKMCSLLRNHLRLWLALFKPIDWINSHETLRFELHS